MATARLGRLPVVCRTAPVRRRIAVAGGIAVAANGTRRPRLPARKATAAPPDKRTDDIVAEPGNTERNTVLAQRGIGVRTDTGSGTGSHRPVAGTAGIPDRGIPMVDIRDRTDYLLLLLLLSARSPVNPNCPVCLSACPSRSLWLYKVLLK